MADETFHWSDLRRPVRRWTALRKVTLIDAIRNGNLDLSEMLALHDISAAELDSWVVKHFAAGPEALKTTRLQQYPGARC